MVDIIKRNKIWFILIGLITIIHVLYASFCQRGAYMDGATFLLQDLSNYSTNWHYVYKDWDHPRFAMWALAQFPIWVSYFILGIKSKYIFSFIFSFFLFCNPLFLLIYNFFLAKRTEKYDLFVINILVYAALVLPCAIYAIVELIPATMIWFIQLHYLISDINYNKKDLIFIIILTVLSIGCYESAVFMGPILFIAGQFYIKKGKDDISQTIKYIISRGALFSFLVSLSYLIFNIGTQEEIPGFFKESGIIFRAEFFKSNFVLSLLTFFLIFIIYRKKELLSKKLLIFICSLYSIFLIIMFSNLKIFVSPWVENQLRTILCWALPFIFLYIIFSNYYNKKFSKIFYTNLLSISLICTFAQTIWQVNDTYWFHKDTEMLAKAIQESSKPLIFAKWKSNYKYFYNYSYTTSSILFSKQKVLNSIFIPYNLNCYTPRLSKNKTEIYLPPCPGLKYAIKNNFWDITKPAKALMNYKLPKTPKTVPKW